MQKVLFQKSKTVLASSLFKLQPLTCRATTSLAHEITHLISTENLTKENQRSTDFSVLNFIIEQYCYYDLTINILQGNFNCNHTTGIFTNIPADKLSKMSISVSDSNNIGKIIEHNEFNEVQFTGEQYFDLELIFDKKHKQIIIDDNSNKVCARHPAYYDLGYVVFYNTQTTWYLNDCMYLIYFYTFVLISF